MSTIIVLKKENVLSEDFGVEYIHDEIMDFVWSGGALDWAMYYEIDDITIGAHDPYNYMGVSFYKDGMCDYKDVARVTLYVNGCECGAEEEGEECDCVASSYAWWIAENVIKAYEAAVKY